MAPRSFVPILKTASALTTALALAAASLCAGPALAAPAGMTSDDPTLISAAVDGCFAFVMDGAAAPASKDEEGAPIIQTEPSPPLCGVMSIIDRKVVDGMLRDKIAGRPEGFTRYKGKAMPGKTVAFEWYCSAPGEKNYLLALAFSRSPEIPIVGFTVRVMAARDAGCDDPKAAMQSY